MRIKFFFVLVVVMLLGTGAWASDPSSLTASPQGSKTVSNDVPDLQTDDAGGPPYYVPSTGWDVDGLCISSQAGYPTLLHYWGPFDDSLLPLTYSPPTCAGAWWSDGNGEPVAPAGEADEWLISPSVDCSTATNLNLGFWSAYTVASYGSAATAHNYVQVSTDGGSTWAAVGDLCHDAAFEYPGTGNNTTWGTPPNGWNGYEVQVQVSLSAYNGESDVRFAFNYVSTDGAAPRGVWMVDDVELRDGLTTLLSENMDGTWVVDPDYVPSFPPTDLTCTDNDDSVDLAWTNNDTYDSIEVYENGVLLATLAGTATSYNVADPPKGTVCYQVCALQGVYVWCTEECCLVYGYDTQELIWDFESDGGGWVIDGTGGWEWGAPTFGTCAGSASGNVWATYLDADYPDLACLVVDSPPITIPGDKGGFICFDHCYETEAEYDGGAVWFTTDDYWYYTWAPVGGGTQIFLGNPGCGNLGSEVPGFTGTSGGWVTDCWDLTDAMWFDEAVKLHLVFASDSSSSTGEGWMVDNVTLYHNGSGTYSCDYTVLPSTGTLAFGVSHRITLTNLLSGTPHWTRRIAARIDVTLGNGVSVSNWKSGYTGVAPGVSFVTSFPVNFALQARFVGTNTFVLTTEDVSPSPYNQPPYPASGDTCVVVNDVVASAP